MHEICKLLDHDDDVRVLLQRERFQDDALCLHGKSINFINILSAPFLYESVLPSFSIITVWLCDFLAKEYRCKICS